MTLSHNSRAGSTFQVVFAPSGPPKESSHGALSSTANFLKAHGWRAGAGYQPGEANFAAIEAWNAAGVYQKAIALMGRQIDGE